MNEKNIFEYNFTQKLFGDGIELLPSVTEIFELQLAFMEFSSVKSDELLRRAAYLKSINSIPTDHYAANTFEPEFEISSRTSKTKSYFENGIFSTGYATHSLFPYRGKFHPQLVKGLLNIIGIQRGETILDPMCGSGTTNLEAALMGINSVAVDISPFCRLMTKTKFESLRLNSAELIALMNKSDDIFKHFSTSKTINTKQNHKIFFNEPNYYLSLLAFLDAMGYSKRTKNSSHIELFKKVFQRYIYTVLNFLRNPFFDKDILGDVTISKDSSAMIISFDDNFFDGIITSPPYSFAIDYASNDEDQLEYLGVDVNKLKSRMIGLRGKNKTERLDNYFEDMKIVCKEMGRVLKPNKFAVIIIGSNTNQTGGIRLEDKIIKYCEEVNLNLKKSILKPIKGMRNTMKDEYILIFNKVS